MKYYQTYDLVLRINLYTTLYVQSLLKKVFLLVNLFLLGKQFPGNSRNTKKKTLVPTPYLSSLCLTSTVAKPWLGRRVTLLEVP